jgi:peroxiredoxin
MRHLLCLSLLLAAAPVMAADSPLGRKVEPFTLEDYRGKTHALADLRDQKAVVVVFLGTECPLAKLYGPRLAELSKKYAEKGVAFVGINANSQDSITEIAAYARVHEVDFPILKDVGNKVADAFAA